MKYLVVRLNGKKEQKKMMTYFVGARIGIAGTEGIKCSDTAFASCVERVDRFEVLIAG